MKRYFSSLFIAVFFISLLFTGCKKSDVPVVIPEKPLDKIVMEPLEITLQKELNGVYIQLKVKVNNLAPGESTEVIWTSNDPRIAVVDEFGVATPEGAGVTEIVATLRSGKGSAKCKVTVTDKNEYKYRLVLTDKGSSEFSVQQPERFLSAKAIERRRKRNIPIDESDLPISTDYLKKIKEVGGVIVAKSKWLNTVTVHTGDQFMIDKYKTLPFVKEVALVWAGRAKDKTAGKYVDQPQLNLNPPLNTPIDYGSAFDNIQTNNGQALHNKGFKGAGIDIAVIDAGFYNANKYPMFKNVNIKGAKSFVYENDDPYSVDNHGIWVTSTMAVNQPGKYVGTAPEASYWLLRSEDTANEYPVEEDYYATAIEFADSVGVDVVNTSLGYTDLYYLESARYTMKDMDGKTAIASRAANFAAEKGIFIVVSAGNESKWIGTPGDSPNVLTLGGVDPKRNLYSASSFGITIDGRMKPDVMAVGMNAQVIGPFGVEIRSGTSYASPIMCGLVACLWQAYPKLSVAELREVIRKSADRANQPVIPFGYGIPDMQKAMDLANAISQKK
ncbi:S8 family serine peptidase [Pedobacter gandavensis]|uniref:S8 family serine peptidase n=1 Tax=Pedobacter gandavensis TaxID=2679963 RepID=UPI00292DDEAB|nr:S8 family serine peptidase [Pedobacter gandavensis]